MTLLKRAGISLLLFAATLLTIMVACAVRHRRRQLVWGPVPILNNKYWSAAMRERGWESVTLMSSYYSRINKRSDFDLYASDLVLSWITSPWLRELLGPLAAFLHVARHARVIHMPYSGGPLAATHLWRLEAPLYRAFGIRTVVLSYGADAYRYSQVTDVSWRHVLMVSYPQAARDEPRIAARCAYWDRHADVVLRSMMVEGAGRWDVLTPSCLCVDTSQWTPKVAYSDADGRNGTVRVVHAPNHRGVKGTEFVIRAVEELRREGLDVELRLLEGYSNDEAREIMRGSDILAEQLIGALYGLNGIEGMALGLPMLCNLGHDTLRVFRRYAFLDECPAVSASPETCTAVLRMLVTNPAMRADIGRASRDYAVKYHSYATAQYLFGSICRRILDGEPIDLMGLFHPATSPYNLATPTVTHPHMRVQRVALGAH